MSASEKAFRAAGAECVAGDLIYKRVVVGRYRGGQFYPTEDGLLIDLPEPSAAPAPTPTAAAPVPAAAPAAPKPQRERKAKAPAAPAAEAAPAQTADSLLADLGSLGQE